MHRNEALDGPPRVFVDLVARRGEEAILIEVRRIGRPRRASEQDAPLEKLATLATERGWKLTVVLVRDDAVDEVDVLSRAEVQRLLDDASKVERSSWIAALASVAAFEAAARFALARVNSIAKPGPLGHVQALATRGLISPDEEQSVHALIRARNAAAHGMSTESIPADLVTRVLDVSTSLLATRPAAA